MQNVRRASSEDILRWPDGTVCTRGEWSSGEYNHMSDDFEVITEDSPEYELLIGPSIRLVAQSARSISACELEEGPSLETGENDAWVP